ncbi:cobalamin-dependent protein [Candidatus Bathyarchaeota archaeon]|nr:cobalamin-dependent protein [Candidatus Bathyarchaeota archaeon]
MRILFIEPPKDYWFLMGEHLPPPLALLQLAAYLEAHSPGMEVDILDCRAMGLDWRGLERRLEAEQPDVVAVSGSCTKDAYIVSWTLKLAKEINPEVYTVTGGQHYSALAEEIMWGNPHIDFIVRGEGERTLQELLQSLERDRVPTEVRGLTFRHGSQVVSTPPQPLIDDLNELPMPAYHLVEESMDCYHFEMMAPGRRYAIVEGSRGCGYSCSFCTQSPFWGHRWRGKSPERLAEEFEMLYSDYGVELIWLADDNFPLDERAEKFCREIIDRGLGDDVSWFVQTRADSVVERRRLLPLMKRAGCLWMLIGVESHSPERLRSYGKALKPETSREAIRLLKHHGIFSQATLIIGDREDDHASIEAFRSFVDELDPDLATFFILTPFPGTRLFEEASSKGWIEDWNWEHYDMIHAVMSTRHLSRAEVQEELYRCYRDFYGSLPRRLGGLLSGNPLRRRIHRYLAGRAIRSWLRSLI